MSDTKISALPAATAVLAADEFAVNEAGTSKKVTAAQIATYAGGSGGASDISRCSGQALTRRGSNPPEFMWSVSRASAQAAVVGRADVAQP